MLSAREKEDRRWMRHALLLAERGAGTASPNPMVGAVIVKNGRKIGEGWHVRPGEAHAEINAIASLHRASQARGAVMYVTLEPCSTWGRTPPCCDALIQCGFSRVVVGSIDPNPRHGGRGLEILRSHGMEVTQGVERKACDFLNRAFFKWIQTKQPYVLLKLAETLDGKIACENGCSKWISCEAARRRVQHLRLLADAVMAGANTYRLDHPRFTVRSADDIVLKTPRRIIVADHPEKLSFPGDQWEAVSLRTSREWQDYLKKLGSEQVLRVLLEGGGELASSALAAGVVDEVEFHVAPKILGGRSSRPSVGGENPLSLEQAFLLKDMEVKKLGCDLLIRGRIH